MDTNIFRAPTQEEKTDMKGLKQKDAKQIFLARLANETQEFVKDHKPFCTKCAVAEFELAAHMKKAELKLKFGGDIDDFHAEVINIANTFPLDKYGKKDYFNLVGETTHTEKKLVGANTWVDIVVIEKNFSCKKYGHGCSISVPREELEDPVKNIKGKSDNKVSEGNKKKEQ